MALNWLERAARPVVRMLDGRYMARLGIANTQALARRYNRLKYGRFQQFRINQARQLSRVLGTDPAKLPDVAMRDGWATDHSRTLPHLEALIEAGEQIIQRRGGAGAEASDQRSFIQNIVKYEDVVEHPAILDFATSPELLKPVVEHMQLVPRLSGDMPPGVRLAESSRQFDPTPDAPPRESQLFHLDIHDRPMVYVIVAIRDIQPDAGPFSFLPAGTSAEVARAIGYRRRRCPYRVPDETVYASASPDQLIEFAHPRGSVLWIDSTRCFHFGSRNAVVPRHQFMFAYISACRTDFTELYMAQQEYPTAPDDPLLRRMLLDRRYMGQDSATS